MREDPLGLPGEVRRATGDDWRELTVDVEWLTIGDKLVMYRENGEAKAAIWR